MYMYRNRGLDAERKKYRHEISRIEQFQQEAKDEEHFRQKLLTRAGRCGVAKLRRFAAALKAMGLNETARWIEMLMIK